ncbi:hypothetical protein FKW31_03680 [Acetobacter sp. DmW_136]|uniref:hypothetical protein n=1 Tax=Acetobacter sp. DmW_136 TaxID=2591091 RepID=UPI001239466E|nr:hypothetical protein [Acetobacter sp. DmW_136]KAA8387749.1 hypothetical protein FKW31_03680 [Acetobacter sp. DmW_136]
MKPHDTTRTSAASSCQKVLSEQQPAGPHIKWLSGLDAEATIQYIGLRAGYIVIPGENLRVARLPDDMNWQLTAKLHEQFQEDLLKRFASKAMRVLQLSDVLTTDRLDHFRKSLVKFLHAQISHLEPADVRTEFLLEMLDAPHSSSAGVVGTSTVDVAGGGINAATSAYFADNAPC